MNEIELAEMVSNRNGQPMTDSRRIAKYFEKEHKNVLQDIDNVGCSADFSRLNFQLSNYIDVRGKSQREFLVSKNGFLFLAMGYTGDKAAKIKENYIKAFDRMEQIITGRFVQSTNPDAEALVSLQSYLGMASLLGASTSLSRAMAVEHIGKNYGINLKPLLSENVADVQEKLIIATKLGKLYTLSPQSMNKKLEELGLLEKVNDEWELTDLGKTHGGTYVDTSKQHTIGTPILQIKWSKDKITSFLKGRISE